jgi:hypothetical protein
MAAAQLKSAVSLRKVRCSCLSCGAHTIAYTGVDRLSGSCGTCGGRNLIPLARREPITGAYRPGLTI